MSRAERLGAALLLVALYALAAWARLHQANAAMVLADATAPWWTAWASPLPLHPHAPPYGWALYLPYAALLRLSGSLWEATCGLLALHALIAPIAAAAALAWRPKAWAAAALIGLTLALDPSLIDTALSGAEGYLGALWLGVMALALGLERRWAPPLAFLAWAAAACNHPLAAFAAPLLLLAPRRRESALGLALAALALAPRALRALSEPAPALSGGQPWEALPAYLEQGGLGAWLLLAGPLLGLLHPRTRPLSASSLLSALLLALAGGWLGYLRDHHLRLLSVPFALGLAGLPRHVPWLGLLLLRPPPDQSPPEGHPQRPGTLGLAHQLGSALHASERRPLVVDGAWLSASPAAEPAALTLDLALRGWTADELSPDGFVAVVISAERQDLAAVHWGGEVLHRGDRHLLVLGTPEEVRALSEALCARFEPRLGGAADALRVLHPARAAEAPWWACR